MSSAQGNPSAQIRSRLLFSGPSLCDGAMGTMLLDCGVPLSRCYDELNLSQPDSVTAIHSAYLDSGAQIIETNTFGANACSLQRYGLEAKARQINLAGARLARYSTEQAATGAFIAGSVGPLGIAFQTLSLADARAAFTDQIRALAEGGPGVGVDLLMIETMTSLAEASEAILAAKMAAPGLPVVVMMTADTDANCLDGSTPEVAAARLADLGADAIGCNCSFGPANVLGVIERMSAATRLPLAAMPNAGLPQNVSGASLYSVTPADMADFARKAVQAGATLIGGCCGTTPAHIRAMKAALSAMHSR